MKARSQDRAFFRLQVIDFEAQIKSVQQAKAIYRAMKKRPCGRLS
jgi:hypothetical protein